MISRRQYPSQLFVGDSHTVTLSPPSDCSVTCRYVDCESRDKRETDGTCTNQKLPIFIRAETAC